MKKYLSIILTLIFMSLLFAGCGKKTKVNVIGPEPTINEFITKMYTVDDYTKIDINKLTLTYPNDKYTNELRKVATSEALNGVIMDRMQLMYITCLYDAHINSKVISTKLDKYITEKDGSIVYNYVANEKFTFLDENKQTDEETSGQVTVKMINNKWIIIQVNKTNTESIENKYRKKVQTF